jgi:hypothetical protein
MYLDVYAQLADFGIAKTIGKANVEDRAFPKGWPNPPKTLH